MEYLKIKYINVGFHFIELILRITMVQTDSKIKLRFERKLDLNFGTPT
jgi:hypothetical protein